MCTAPIVCRVFLTSLIFEDAPAFFTSHPHFSNFVHLLPAVFVALFLWLNLSSRHGCVILLNDVVDLNLLHLGILVLEAPCCVLYATRHRIYWKFNKNHMVFAITLVCYHNHRKTNIAHTGTNILTQILIYISTTCYECTAATCITLN